MIEILYTDTDQIREALQVVEEDLEDERFSRGTVELDLTLDLDAWVPTHATIFSEGQEPGSTEEQLRKFKLLKAYCTYFCAYQTLQTGPLSLPDKIGDGKNMIDRIQDRQAMLDFIIGRMLAYKNQLLEALSGSSAPFMKQFVGVGSSYDPVTG